MAIRFDEPDISFLRHRTFISVLEVEVCMVSLIADDPN
jgi:hypothetical protein